MSVPKNQLEALKQKIRRSFDNAPYPKGTIAPHECDECREVRQAFRGQDWKTIAPEIVEENHGILPLFSPDAFRYFLPAYLIYSLDHFEDFDTVCMFTIYALTPSNKDIETGLDHWRNKFSEFNAEQMNCVYEFLDLVRIDEEFMDSVNEISNGRRNLKEFIEPSLKK